jgi:hypothetical protein
MEDLEYIKDSCYIGRSAVKRAGYAIPIHLSASLDGRFIL